MLGTNMHPALCSFGITPAAVVPPPSLVIILTLLVLLSIVSLFMLVSFVCHTGVHYDGACCASICHAGVPFVVLVLVMHCTSVLVWHLLCWYLLWHGCGFVTQVWHSSDWYLLWVVLALSCFALAFIVWVQHSSCGCGI